MSFDPQLQQAIAAHAAVYLRDLGIYDFYRRDTDLVIEPTPEEPVIRPRQPVLPQPPVGSFVAPPSRIEALRAIQFEIGDCTRCALSTGRNKIVFGDGDPNARLMFVGEGPGADEDAQGLPFVGRAGQLLNNMIAATGLKREQVYIANIVKCRPPAESESPEPEEWPTPAPLLLFNRLTLSGRRPSWPWVLPPRPVLLGREVLAEQRPAWARPTSAGTPS